MIGKFRLSTRYVFIFVSVFVLFVNVCHANECPLFDCSPGIASLDHNTLNSTFEIVCNFRNRIESTDIMWKFKMGDVERIINPPEGGILSPFRHEFLQLNNSINVQSVSKLKIYLVNSSYYTNYTLMNTRDSCQIKSRLHLQERALMYTNSSTRPGSQSLITAVLLSLFLCEIVCLNWFTNIRF